MELSVSALLSAGGGGTREGGLTARTLLLHPRFPAQPTLCEPRNGGTRLCNFPRSSDDLKADRMVWGFDVEVRVQFTTWALLGSLGSFLHTPEYVSASTQQGCLYSFIFLQGSAEGIHYLNSFVIVRKLKSHE